MIYFLFNQARVILAAQAPLRPGSVTDSRSVRGGKSLRPRFVRWSGRVWPHLKKYTVVKSSPANEEVVVLNPTTRAKCNFIFLKNC